MVGIGTLLALLGVVVAVRARPARGGCPSRAWFYRAVVAAGPLSLVALIAGWVTTEVGRQPWVVYRVMRTDAGRHRRRRHPGRLRGAGVVYIAVAVAVVWILRRLARAPLDVPERRPRGWHDLAERPAASSSLAGLALYVGARAARTSARALWQLLAGRGRAGRARPRPRAPRDGAGLGGQPRLADLRADGRRGRPIRRRSARSPRRSASPLFLAGVGIILRGAAYALRSARRRPARAARGSTRVFGVSSVLTPFALGACVGAIASGRVPVGNAARRPVSSSWLNPTSITIGVLAVVLAPTSPRSTWPPTPRRRGRRRAGRARSARARWARARSPARWRSPVSSCCTRTRTRCTAARHGRGAAGADRLGRSPASRRSRCVLRRRLRAGAALAPRSPSPRSSRAGRWLSSRASCPGLTVEQAAAPHDTLVAVVVAVVGGGILLFPSLALLLRLTLGGALGHGGDPVSTPPERAAPAGPPLSAPSATRLAGAFLIGGFGLLTIAESGWAHAVGVVSLLGFVVTGFLAVVPAWLAPEEG